MFRVKYVFIFILILTAAALAVDLPVIPINFRLGSYKIETKIGAESLNFNLFGRQFNRPLDIKRGLDLQGGLHVILKAEMAEIGPEKREAALLAVRDVIERRVNLFGVSEANVQTAHYGADYRIIVELPGVADVDKALSLIGQTAQLDFRESLEATPSSLASFKPTGLTGRDLESSSVTFDTQTGEPQVALEFNSGGGTKFEEITRRNVGRTVAIFLDEEPLSIPRVDEAISGGSAVIRGRFTLEEAKKLSIQLNAGALPVPIKVLEQRQIGATLGKESVERSVIAGTLGLLLVAFFMWSYYGRLGLIADVALIIYGLLTLALYKLVPVVLTLPGLAGFLLSIGEAVDANILIFERIKEERRTGRPLMAAMELGFGRAWNSIRDANVCTLIACFVLFNPFGWSFLNSTGPVRGFAVTLALGIFVSLFTGIVVTRTLIRIFYR